MAAAPVLAGSDGIAARGKSRPARAAWTLAGVVVVAVLLAAVTLVLVYRPLRQDGGVQWAGQLRGGPGSFAYGPAGTDLHNTFGSGIVAPPMPNGGRLGVVMDLSNRSPLPVTVLGVEPFLLEKTYSRGTRVFVDAGAEDAMGSLKAVDRFTVLAHGSRTVGFAVDVRADCQPGNRDHTVTTDVVRLRYRFAGIPRTRTIELHEFAVSLVAP